MPLISVRCCSMTPGGRPAAACASALSCTQPARPDNSMRDATFTVSPNTQKRARSTPMTPDTTGPEATPTRMRTAPCDGEISVAAAAAWRSSANRSAARAWSSRAGNKPDTAKYESLVKTRWGGASCEHAWRRAAKVGPKGSAEVAHPMVSTCGRGWRVCEQRTRRAERGVATRLVHAVRDCERVEAPEEAAQQRHRLRGGHRAGDAGPAWG